MYTSGIYFERTDEERNDPFLAWAREDKAFFASGACHILAYVFLSLHSGDGFELIHIKPYDNKPGHHMYASDGMWAFDFAGWTPEEELLEAHESACKEKRPDWSYKRIVVKEHFVDYIKKENHMPPEYFPHLPWERAYTYIKNIESNSPVHNQRK